MRASLLILCLLGILVGLCGCNSYSRVVKLPIAVAAITSEQEALANSLRSLTKQPLARMGSYLDAVDDARRRLKADPTDPTARADYNFAVARVIEVMDSEGLEPWEAPVSLPSKGGGDWQLTLTAPDPRPEYHPSNFEIVAADRYRFRGKLVGERTIKDGLGAPVVVIGKDLDFTAYDEFALGEQVHYGLTVLI